MGKDRKGVNYLSDRKKQVVSITSLALIAFFIGSIVNANSFTSAKGDKDKRGVPYIWEAIYELQDKVDNLNASYFDLLERVETLESVSGFLGAPSFDSGWMEWSSSMVINHNLNTTEVLVYLIGKSGDGVINIAEFGRYCYWRDLTSTHITLNIPNIWEWSQARVMIWEIQPPT